MTKTPRSTKPVSRAKKPSDAANDRRKRSGTSGGSAARTVRGGVNRPDAGKLGLSKLGVTRAGASQAGLRMSVVGQAKPSKSGAGKSGASRAGASKSGASKSSPSKSAISRGVKTRSAVPDGSNLPRSANEVDEARTLALAAIEAALDKKALMPVLLDVSAMASYTDFIGIVSGRSDRQVEAIADGISQFMKSRGRHVFGHEGRGSGRWTLLDFGEIVIHVFYHPVREFYDLESLWIDAPRVKMAIPPEAILAQPDVLYGTL